MIFGLGGSRARNFSTTCEKNENEIEVEIESMQGGETGSSVVGYLPVGRERLVHVNMYPIHVQGTSLGTADLDINVPREIDIMANRCGIQRHKMRFHRYIST